MNAIVKRADSSVGSFYARFDGKEDLIRYLQDQVWAHAMERWDESLATRDWTQLDLDAVIDGVVGLLMKSFREDYEQRRALGRELRGQLRGGKKVLDFHQHILSSVTPLFLARRDGIRHPDPEWAIRLGYRFAVGAIREVLELEELAGIVDGGGSTEDLIPELARAWASYLGIAESQEVDESRKSVDFFDPWN